MSPTSGRDTNSHQPNTTGMSDQSAEESGYQHRDDAWVPVPAPEVSSETEQHVEPRYGTADKVGEPFRLGTELPSRPTKPLPFSERLNRRTDIEGIIDSINQRFIQGDNLEACIWAGEHSSDFEDKWISLIKTVSGLVNTYLALGGKVLSWERLSSDTKATLNHWTPNAREYLEDPKRVPWVIMARIFHTIDERYWSLSPSARLASGTKADKLMSDFASIADRFEEKYNTFWHQPDSLSPVYYNWRWTTWKLLMHFGARTDTGTDALASHIARDIADLIGEDTGDQMSSILLSCIEVIAKATATFEKVCWDSPFKAKISWRPYEADIGGFDTRGWKMSSSDSRPMPLRGVLSKALMDAEEHDDEDDDSVVWTEEDKLAEGKKVDFVVVPCVVVDCKHQRHGPSACYMKPMYVVLEDFEPQNTSRTKREVEAVGGDKD